VEPESESTAVLVELESELTAVLVEPESELTLLVTLESEVLVERESELTAVLVEPESELTATLVEVLSEETSDEGVDGLGRLGVRNEGDLDGVMRLMRLVVRFMAEVF
jgi:hypothetical protein